ncbi:NmrA family transcriptional regulator [Mycobacterium bourgelatii]|uniref:NmrA family transcriptional regulator n=1 Tax=Mycobacterium bourgelatii TaxID=1273442 RepID=A0A7I9YLE4_MYCBU|nr:NmrA family transcriptional regulator [Mycobacterium bourgelatii]
MKILVIGATGGTGAQVVKQALARGHSVKVQVRDRVQAAQFDQAEVMVGDVRDAAAVDSALSGVDAVVCCLGVRLGQDPGTVRSAGTANLVAQMRRHGVRRLIAVSTVGVGSSVADQSRIARMMWPRMVGRPRLIEADRAEAAIRDGGDELAWTLVRPPRLVDGAGGARLQVGPSVRTGMRSQLARADLASVLLDQVTDERYVGAAVTAVATR